MMRHGLDYDKTYAEAIQTPDPTGYSEQRWGDGRLYFNEFIAPLVTSRKDMCVLEVGAGLGRYTRLIKPYCKSIYAVEASDICLEHLPKVIPGVVACKYTQVSEKVPDNCVDFAFSFSTMLHFNQYEMAWYLRVLHSKLKQGSKFVVHYSDIDCGRGDFRGQIGTNFGEHGIYNFYSEEFLEKIATIMGYSKVSCIAPKKPIIPVHKVMILVRK